MNRFKCPACGGKSIYISGYSGGVHILRTQRIGEDGDARAERKRGRGRMKKLEQAIAYFEDAIKESDEIIAGCSEKLPKEKDKPGCGTPGSQTPSKSSSGRAGGN